MCKIVPVYDYFYRSSLLTAWCTFAFDRQFNLRLNSIEKMYLNSTFNFINTVAKNLFYFCF